MQKISPVFPDDSITQRIQILQPVSGIILTSMPIFFIGAPQTRKFYYSYPSCTKVLVEWNYYHPNLQGWGRDTFDLLPNGTSIVTFY